jgi:hypothetical protein
MEFLAINSAAVPSLDALEYYARYPLNFRTLNERQLQSLTVFSQEIAQRTASFLRRTPASTLEMLQDSLQLSPLQILVLKVCTRLESRNLSVHLAQTQDTSLQIPSVPTLQLWYRTRTRFWASPQRGFTSDATQSQQYQGSPLDLYQRLTVRLANNTSALLPNTLLEGNITAAKDAGERTITDFLSGYLRAELGGKTHIVVGDYLVESGMGTVLWGIFGARKSADVISPATQQQFRIVPYRSSTEQQYFRGVAAQSEFVFPVNKNADSVRLSVKGWYSSQSRAARVDTIANVATSLNVDGLFRTRSEISLLGGLLERIGGIGAEISHLETNERNSLFGAWSVGAVAMLIDYDKPITSRSVMVFSGQRGVNASIFGRINIGEVLLCAEIARDAQNNIGGRIGAEWETQNWEFATLARAFPTEFRAPFGVNFGETPKPSNEGGLYIGAVWKGAENLRLNSYLDVYTSISSTATIPVPVRGVDLFSEATWRIIPTLTAYIRARHETKTDVVTVGSGRNRERIIFGRGKSSLRLHADVGVSPELRIQSRVEGVLVSFENAKPQETGVLGFVGIQWKPSEAFSATMRLVGYSTGSFDTAIWQYEQTIAGTLSNPALYGQGIRAYCLLETDIVPNCTISARGSLTRRFDVNSFGSGSTLVNSNTDAQFYMQVDIRF